MCVRLRGLLSAEEDDQQGNSWQANPGRTSATRHGAGCCKLAVSQLCQTEQKCWSSVVCESTWGWSSVSMLRCDISCRVGMICIRHHLISRTLLFTNFETQLPGWLDPDDDLSSSLYRHSQPIKQT